MNKKLIAGIMVVAVLVAVMLFVVLGGSKDNGTGRQNKSTAKSSLLSNYKVVDACKVLSTSLASEILGETVTAKDSGSNQTSTDSINVSDCSYATKFVAGQAASVKSVSLLARSAKDGAGADSNKDQFKSLPSGAQPVTGYGDAAYWDTNFHQLNILKHDNWYILSNGPSTASEKTLDQAKVLADHIIDQL